MNLFQSGCLGCLAQTYLHIYFNKLCSMGTTKERQDSLGREGLSREMALESWGSGVRHFYSE